MRNIQITALLAALAVVLGAGAGPALAAEDDFLYDPGTVNVIEMTLPPAGIAGLESEPFEYQPGGTVVVTPTDGTPGGKGTPSKTFQNVEVKLKGKPQGSFEDLGHKAAFKLKFKKAEPFFGLRKLTLNNMTQDPSMIHESLAYEAFAAAGVPASRSGYAYVWLNGENYGLHLNLESLDTVSLPKIFSASSFDAKTQHLYEANEYGADFYPGKESRFEVDEGEDDTSDLSALIAAVDAAAPDPLPASLSTLVDLDEMTRMWGAEKYIGHWDGYAGEGVPGEEEFNTSRPNNYYLYSDPSGRFSMLPWGTDQTWERHLAFDGQDGRLFDLCREDETCAGKFSTAVANALDEIGGLDLDSRAAATAAMLEAWQALEAAPRKPFDAGEIAAAVSATRDFIADRPGEAEEWLAAHPPPAPPAPPTTPVSGVPSVGDGPVAKQVHVFPPPRVRVGRIHFADGVLRTWLSLPGAGVVSQQGTIPGRRGPWPVCDDRLETDGARSATLRCDLSHAARERLHRHWLRLTVVTRFRGIDGTLIRGSRQIVLPRD